MINQITDCTTLNNGVKMPWLGLGVYQMGDGAEVERLVNQAVEIGYRSIDTAAAYGNEAGVGQAVKSCGIDRERLFITTKVWNADQGYQSTLTAFEKSRKKLDLDYIDLYLVHWPVKQKYRDTWRALRHLYESGVVRAIGVSNFHVHHFEAIMQDSDLCPAVNQVELHPFLAQHKLRDYCNANKIQVEAWSPLMKGQFMDNATFVELANKYGRTPAQIILRWDLQHAIVTIPKSSNPMRIAENAGIFDFELSPEDMSKLDALNTDTRTDADPDNFNF